MGSGTRASSKLKGKDTAASLSASSLWTYSPHLSLLLRIFLLAFGTYQDAHSPVKYTDIDYAVFTDAASLVASHQSPYDRSTYRYTPLLAWILTPTVMWPVFGKVVFAGCDLMVGSVLQRILVRRGVATDTARKMVAICWGLNPFVAVISTRGNAESLIAGLVVGMLGCLLEGRRGWAAVLFGVAVHVKMGLVVWLGIVFAKDLPFSFFAQTFAFVMMNKVVTSQYFMWYLCFLPLILTSSRLLTTHKTLGIALIGLWVFGQAFWLLFAYLLEHKGWNTFRQLWGAGAVFAVCNGIVLGGMIWAHQGKVFRVDVKVKKE
ncbi:pentamidine resistance factor [Dinochytrium kinnereticum]|nr:pentamidine resistance factor [Dinochytrium kinnereticum]